MPAQCRRRGRSAPSGRVALVGADGVVGQLELVALADEQSERAIASTIVGRGLREAPAQDGEGGLELLAGAALAERGRDQRRIESDR